MVTPAMRRSASLVALPRERQGYENLAMSMAEDDERVGHISLADAEVTTDGEPLLLPPEKA